MTAANLIARRRSVLSWARSAAVTLLLMVALAGAVVVAVWSWDRARDAKRAQAAAPERASEEAGARKAGVPVVEQVPDLRPFAARLLQENADLKRALDEAQKVVPGAQTAGAIRATVEGVAHGKPRPQDAPPISGGDVAGPSAVGSSSPPAGRTCLSCLLADGDELRLEVEGLQLRGPAGGRYLVGTMAARRKLDGELLLREPLSGQRVEAVEEAERPPLEPGWGGGLTVVAHRGLVTGLVLAPPPQRWWRVQIEPSLSIGCEPGGKVLGVCRENSWAASASVLARWMR